MDGISTEAEMLAPNLSPTKFSNAESLDIILDLIDEYVELKEAVEI